MSLRPRDGERFPPPLDDDADATEQADKALDKSSIRSDWGDSIPECDDWCCSPLIVLAMSTAPYPIPQAASSTIEIFHLWETSFRRHPFKTVSACVPMSLGISNVPMKIKVSLNKRDKAIYRAINNMRSIYLLQFSFVDEARKNLGMEVCRQVGHRVRRQGPTCPVRDGLYTDRSEMLGEEAARAMHTAMIQVEMNSPRAEVRPTFLSHVDAVVGNHDG